MKSIGFCLLRVVLLILFGTIFVAGQGETFNSPIPTAAKTLVDRGTDLVADDKFNEASAVFKQAISVAPNYLKAHVEYIRLKTYYQFSYNDVRIEYEALMSKEPTNPVYPMALVLGAGSMIPNRVTRTRNEKVVALAPDWAWGHYAKAMLMIGGDPETAAAELGKAIEKDPTAFEFYNRLVLIQERQLKRIDDAIATAEKMAARPELSAAGLGTLWRLRLGKAQGSDEAKAKLKRELDQSAASSQNVDILGAVRNAYKDLLKDESAAKTVESKIRKLDPAWYPELGLVTGFGAQNLSKVDRHEPLGGRQVALLGRANQLDNDESTAKEIIAGEEALLTQNPGPVVRRFIYETIFRVAEKSQDASVMIKYGQPLLAIDPSDVAIYARIGLVLADQGKDLNQSLQYAKLADEATLEFHPLQPSPLADPDWFKANFPEERQRKIYQGVRAVALEAYGWALCKTGECDKGEIKLKQSVELERSERNLLHLADILRKLGRDEEAEKTAIEAKNEYAESIRRQFENYPASDFVLESIDGRKVKLSDYKGKVVMLTFWATWCGPCHAEMPVLAEIYRKYQEHGVEILAISTDEIADRHKVVPYAKAHNVNFPVLYGNGTEAGYGVSGLPTTVFIDRDGNVRYQSQGFFSAESVRLMEVVLAELLK